MGSRKALVLAQFLAQQRARFWFIRTRDHPKANVSATHAVRFARRDEVDRDWRRQLSGLPFRARQSSYNGPVRLDQRFSEDRLRALLVEGGDAMHLRPPPAFFRSTHDPALHSNTRGKTNYSGLFLARES